MKPYILHYYTLMGYSTGDSVPCELCGSEAVDIHHIQRRGMGGKNKQADCIENLMALCRFHHDNLGDKKKLKNGLYDVHFGFMVRKGVPINPLNLTNPHSIEAYKWRTENAKKS